MRSCPTSLRMCLWSRRGPLPGPEVGPQRLRAGHNIAAAHERQQRGPVTLLVSCVGRAPLLALMRRCDVKTGAAFRRVGIGRRLGVEGLRQLAQGLEVRVHPGLSGAAGGVIDGGDQRIAAFSTGVKVTGGIAALTAAMSVSPNATAIYPVTGRVADTAFLDPEHLLVLSGKGALTTLDLGMRKTATTALATSPLPIGLVPDGQGGATTIFADTSMTTLDGKPVAAATTEDFAPRAGTVRASADGKLVAMVGLIGDVLVRDCRTLPCRDTHLTAPAGTDPGLLAGSLAVKPDGTGLAVNWWPGLVAVYGDLAASPKLTALPSDLASLGVVVGMDWSAVTDRIVL
eukprot:gene5509-7484_t